ncbi:stromal cell-derived factor 2 [Onthophagus taurus]|uniref:stromal cell-derived factor 2 n=1 Tax=Onthophagus taurus TaxID=166361 RepID=UPI000C1FF4D4|nr:stromal cell-derived factor 2 [Onthophagus taurus]
MKNIIDLFISFFLVNTICNFSTIAGAKQRYVTCGSVVKLMNSDYRVRLHSHDVKYGTGSGQQSVTGTEVQEDVNSHWAIKAGTGEVCQRGKPIPCGSVIRLEHITTNKNLHSHHFSSPLSGNQEISCYGDDKGEGDTGDHWMVVCPGDSWTRDDNIMLKHIDTNQYLAASGKTFGRPINGQMEIVGVRSTSGSVHWQAMEGVFLHAPNIMEKHIHTEL